MESRRSPLIIIIGIFVAVAAVGIWYYIGSNTIISAVPDSDASERIILVTPAATPTSEVIPTEVTPDQEATPSPTTKAAAPTSKPTVAATRAAATPTKSAATPTGSSATPTGSTATPTPTASQ